MKLTTKSNLAAYLTISLLSYIAISPKWNIAIFAWIAPLFLLRATRDSKKIFHVILFAFSVNFISALIAYHKVIPFDFITILITHLIGSIIATIPYLMDYLFKKKNLGFFGTFIFPSTFTLIDFFNASGPQGVWGNLANSQYEFSYISQFASVFGIWGISFLIYWAASVLNDVYNNYREGKSFKKSLVIYFGVIVAVIMYGGLRLKNAVVPDRSVKVATITNNNLTAAEILFEIEFGYKKEISIKSYQSDPDLDSLGIAQKNFLDNPMSKKYEPYFKELESIFKKFLNQSEIAVNKGAKIIVWSEAAFTTIKTKEHKFIEIAKEFAKSNEVYFYFPMGVLLPDEYKKNNPFIENKVLVINDQGIIENEYYKNVPVPNIDPSIPGSGDMTPLKTKYGAMSVAICYDADMPNIIAKTGKSETEVLLIPSGDWYDISPYHSYMAAFRSIENGISVVRPAGYGLSMVTDNFGRIISEDDFFADSDHLLIADIPVTKVNTIYNKIGNVLVLISILVLIISMLIIPIRWLLLLNKNQKFKKEG